MGTVLGGLLLPEIRPFDLGRSTTQAINAAGGMLQNQSALMALQDLQRQQATAAEERAFLQQHPEFIFGGGGMGQSPLASLNAGGPAGAMTQQAFGPGGAGATQTIPASPDASRYAGVSPESGGPIPPDLARQVMPTVTPPQSTLGTLNQPQDNPLLALARRDPTAALALYQRQQQMEDATLKRQEQRLVMGEKVMESLGQMAQGVTDQASLEKMKDDLQRLGLGQYVSRLPQVYSKEAMQPFIDQALSVKDSLQARLEQQKMQALVRGQDVDMLKLQQQSGKLNYQTDAQGNIVAVPEYANGTTLQARPVLGADGQPIKSLEGQKLTQQQQTQIRTQENELRTHVDKLLTDYYTVRDSMGRIEASGVEPSAAGDLALITAFMKMLDPTTGVRDIEFKNAASAGGFYEQVKARLGYVQSGERLSEAMRADLLTRSRKLYEQYEKDYGQVKQQYRDLTTRLGGNPANVVLETGSTAAKASTTGKPVAQMSREELLAERDRLRKGGS